MAASPEPAVPATTTATLSIDLAVHLLSEGLRPPPDFAWLFRRDAAGLRLQALPLAEVPHFCTRSRA